MKEAILVQSFGGPEKPEDVLPFLEIVTRGRNIPRERLLEVAEHYYHFGGRSPINDQNRELIAALRRHLEDQGTPFAVYWGNRNWRPFLEDTVREMRADGIERAYAFATSAYSSYSGCRQYREDLVRAAAAVGEGAPELIKLRPFFNHPGFIDPMIERVQAAFAQVPPEAAAGAHLVFTAHSIPLSMADTCDYVPQIRESCRLVAEGCGRADYTLAYQSRSGAPTQPWLEPDIGDWLRALAASPAANRHAIVAPIGFISDHMEVLYDLDEEAKQLAGQLGIHLVRAGTVGAHPRFVRMIVELVEEQTRGAAPLARGHLPPVFCRADCCPPPARPAGRPPGRV